MITYVTAGPQFAAMDGARSRGSLFWKRCMQTKAAIMTASRRKAEQTKNAARLAHPGAVHLHH
jgi:hypothetical protein